jgi:hypothetical protein
MAKWYRTRWHDSHSRITGAEIAEVEILKCTSSTVWVDGRRRAKRSDFENYFETKEEARQFIIKALKQQRDIHAEELKEYEAAIARWMQ